MTDEEAKLTEYFMEGNAIGLEALMGADVKRHVTIARTDIDGWCIPLQRIHEMIDGTGGSVADMLQALATEPTLGAVFPNRKGVPYTASGFASNWQKLMVEALAKGVVDQRFTFHDLRAHYTSEHKTQHGTLPDLHASPTTTATIYERSKVARRRSL
jgi:integrase